MMSIKKNRLASQKRIVTLKSEIELLSHDEEPLYNYLFVIAPHPYL